MARLTIIRISFIIVSLMFAGQSHAQVDPESILGMWLLDEGKGDTTEDASGNGNDGTLMGAPNWVAGNFDDALEFTGSGTYVNCGNAEALNVNVFSVSFWCNFPSAQGWNHIISRGSHVASGTPGSVNWGVMMYDAQETILFETFNDTGWSGITATTTAGEWHHVVATYDGDTMQLYHDGALASTTSGAGILLDPGRAFVIGARSDSGGAGGFFSGSIDDVGYFSVVLSPENIQAIMDYGLEGIIGGQPLARRPDPEDGALLLQTWGSLSWSAGDWAVSHDVYVGENFDDVNDGAADTFRGNHASTTLILGFAGFPFPDGLVPGTTYYWRIDEVNDANAASPWKGDVWSFSIPAKTAYNPVPGDGAKFIETDGITLGWAPGLGAKLHTVYFGDNFDEINNASGGVAQTVTIFTPGTLELDKTYYWRVDEFDPPATHKGDIWSFTTAGLGGGVKGQYFQGMNFNTLMLTRPGRIPRSTSTGAIPADRIPRLAMISSRPDGRVRWKRPSPKPIPSIPIAMMACGCGSAVNSLLTTGPTMRPLRTRELSILSPALHTACRWNTMRTAAAPWPSCAGQVHTRPSRSFRRRHCHCRSRPAPRHRQMGLLVQV